jgi:hypothetical protein
VFTSLLLPLYTRTHTLFFIGKKKIKNCTCFKRFVVVTRRFVTISLLTSARDYVEKNINKRMELITESWEITKNMVSFGTRAHDFHEYLQVELKN